MTDTAQLEMRLNRASDKISRLKGDVQELKIQLQLRVSEGRELKKLVKDMQLQLKDHMEAEHQRRLANYRQQVEVLPIFDLIVLKNHMEAEHQRRLANYGLKK